MAATPSWTLRDLRPEMAEALGVFLIVALGGTAILADAGGGGLGATGVGLVFAFLVAALIYALGHVCGAHYNPAVTLAFAATGHFPWRRVPGYLAAQVAGALLASLLLHAIFGDVAPVATRLQPGMEPLAGAAIEMLATFLLALVIIAVATDRRVAPGIAGLAIGLSVGLGAMAAGPLTGGSMNPARSLGPAIVSGQWEDLWVYLLPQAVGALAGMFAYEGLRGSTRPRPDEEPLGSLGPFSLHREP